MKEKEIEIIKKKIRDSKVKHFRLNLSVKANDEDPNKDINMIEEMEDL